MFVNAASLFGAISTTDVLLLLTMVLGARGCASSQYVTTPREGLLGGVGATLWKRHVLRI
jgi:hypothetical protein